MRVDQVMRLAPSGMGSVPSQQRPRREPLVPSLPPCEDAAKRQPSVSQEEALTSAFSMPGSAFLWLMSTLSRVFQLQQPKRTKTLLSFVISPQSPILPGSTVTKSLLCNTA